MAAPTKNLVDATGPTPIAPQNHVPLIPVKVTSQKLLSMSIPIVNVDFTIVHRFEQMILIAGGADTIKVPLYGVVVNQKYAGEIAFNTFPAMYSERVSTRPTEGQIWPRGIK